MENINSVAFHLAFPILDLEETRHFYGNILGCEIGRESERWIDFNFFGHQLSGHICTQMPQISTNLVDGKNVPVSHFGAVLNWNDWEALSQKLKSHQVEFLIEPYIRFKGEVGEQGTFFILDPSGNGLEFKTFKDMNSIFAK